ncbi:MAG TPA: dihydropteroate synthase [Desulfomonilia bacterium]
MSNSTASSERRQPKARLLSFPDYKDLISCGIDPGALPYLEPKLYHRVVLLKDVRLFAANIIKQTMLSIGGDAAVHRSVISGKVEYSDCIIMGDLRHYKNLVDKLKIQPNMSDIACIISQQLNLEERNLRLNLCSRKLEWETRPLVMGIVNVTPDSFSDGGMYDEPETAIEHALELIGQGADIIDVGGESTRPGASTIDEKTEIKRILPVVKGIALKTEVPVSIDTRNASVAEAAMDSGASIINDVSSMTHDKDMITVAKKTGAGIVLMHMRGSPADMQSDTIYADIVSEIYDYIEKRVEVCLEAGIDPLSIIIDPGIGFGKKLEGNLSLIKHIREFSSLGLPVMLGHSRKSFIGKVLDSEVQDREEGTDAVTSWAAMQNVDIVRVHNVMRAKRTIRMINSILRSE